MVHCSLWSELSSCDMYLASHGNKKLLDEIIEWFKKERNETIKPEQIRCERCRGPLDVHWSSNCKMMFCARKRGLQYCFQCGDFPCTSVNEFSSDGISHHKRTVENSKRMKEIGIEAWIVEQKRKGNVNSAHRDVARKPLRHGYIDYSIFLVF